MRAIQRTQDTRFTIIRRPHGYFMDMKKFSSQQRELIESSRVKIRSLNEEQNKLYHELLKELNLSIYVEDWMFDYIYNDFGSIEEIEERMK